MGDFLTVILPAAAIATGIATSVTALLSVWWRRVDAQRPEWTQYGGESHWQVGSDAHGNIQPPQGFAHIANTGTGTASRVQFLGIGCNVTVSEDTPYFGAKRKPLGLLAAMLPGMTVCLDIWCEPIDWDTAQVAILWRESSLWRRPRKARVELINLSMIANRPIATSTTLDPVSGGVTKAHPVVRGESAARFAGLTMAAAVGWLASRQAVAQADPASRLKTTIQRRSHMNGPCSNRRLSRVLKSSRSRLPVMSTDAKPECDESIELQHESAALVLNELTRQIDRQAADITNARSRATGLLSAAGVVNGVFGFSGMTNGGDQLELRPLSILALAAFALMVVSLLPTLIPRKFELRGDLVHHLVRLEEGIPTRRLDVAISLATSFDQMIKKNAPKINSLYWCVTVGSVLLAAQVLLWAVGVIA